jgi:hypothetical protein
MREFPQAQWFLSLCTDPGDWVAQLRPFRTLANMGAFLVSLRRLSADMADLTLLGPPFEPMPEGGESLLAPLDKGKQAEATTEVPQVAGGSAELVVGAPNTAERGHFDDPLLAQGFVRNEPEVSRSILDYSALVR